MVLCELAGHPGVQVLPGWVPRGQGEQDGDQAAGRPVFEQVQQEADQQHGLARTGLAEDHQTAGGDAFEDLDDLASLAGQSFRVGSP